MKSRQLQSTVLIGIALLIAVVFISLAQTADHPVAAAGIGLQTLAGLFAAVQLWANNASNALLRCAADQIDSNRWHVTGLLDGRLRSLMIATVWAVGGFFSLGLPGALDPPTYIGWPLAIAVAALAITGATAFFLAYSCAPVPTSWTASRSPRAKPRPPFRLAWPPMTGSGLSSPSPSWPAACCRSPPRNAGVGTPSTLTLTSTAPVDRPEFFAR